MNRRKHKATKARRPQPVVNVGALVVLAVFSGFAGCMSSPAVEMPLSPHGGSNKSSDPSAAQQIKKVEQDHTEDHKEIPPPAPVSPREAVANAKRSIEKSAEQLWGTPPPTMPANPHTPEGQQPVEDQPRDPGADAGGTSDTTPPPDPTAIDTQPTTPQPITQPIKPPISQPPAPDPEQEALELAARCAQTCDAASGICESRAAICEIADNHPLDETFQVDCAWADQICSRAQDTCAECQAAH